MNHIILLPACIHGAVRFARVAIPQTAWSVPAKNLLQYIPRTELGHEQFRNLGL